MTISIEYILFCVLCFNIARNTFCFCMLFLMSANFFFFPQVIGQPFSPKLFFYNRVLRWFPGFVLGDNIAVNFFIQVAFPPHVCCSNYQMIAYAWRGDAGNGFGLVVEEKEKILESQPWWVKGAKESFLTMIREYKSPQWNVQSVEQLKRSGGKWRVCLSCRSSSRTQRSCGINPLSVDISGVCSSFTAILTTTSCHNLFFLINLVSI